MHLLPCLLSAFAGFTLLLAQKLEQVSPYYQYIGCYDNLPNSRSLGNNYTSLNPNGPAFCAAHCGFAFSYVGIQLCKCHPPRIYQDYDLKPFPSRLLLLFKQHNIRRRPTCGLKMSEQYISMYRQQWSLLRRSRYSSSILRVPRYPWDCNSHRDQRTYCK